MYSDVTSVNSVLASDKSLIIVTISEKNVYLSVR